jgi:twitching motility protein PilT
VSTSESSLLGRIAVAAKLITLEQLAVATREQVRRQPRRSLGELLVELGYLTPAGLQRLLALQKNIVDPAEQERPPAAAQPSPRVTPAATAAQPRTPLARVPLARTPLSPAGGAAAAEPKPIPRSAPAEIGVESDARAAESLAREARGSAVPAAAAPAGARATGTAKSQPAVEIGRILVEAAQLGASDVHIHSGAPLRYRIHGRLEDRGSTPLSADRAGAMALSLLGAAERDLFDERGEIDFAYTLEGVARFRTNLYRQLRGIDATLRTIPLLPRSLSELRLPNELARFTNYHQGMVLVTGPTRCGKSSTLAALVRLINEERTEHVLTIEDPIEHLHRSGRCLVNQRNVGRHTRSFARALRAGLREDPDVIVIGELRDRETVSLALTAAETGHFVLATLHTDNAIRTVSRIIGSFPPDQQEQVRAMVSESLRAVISQRLLPRPDGKGVVPALEVLVNTRAVANLIRESKEVQLRGVLQTGKASGMRLLDTSLAELVASKTITREEALRHADDARLIPG